MKKTVFVIAFVILGLATSVAQNNFEVGINGMLPIGDLGDFTSFGVAADVSYNFELSEKFTVGPKLSYYHYFSDVDRISSDDAQLIIDVKDLNFLPIAAAGKYEINDKLYVGLDAGYVIGINDAIDGSFFYKPQVGYNVTDKISVIASYSEALQKKNALTSMNLGVAYKF